MSVEIGRAITPPDRTTLAKRALRLLDLVMRSVLRGLISGSSSAGYRSARAHQAFDELLAPGRRK
jgi:hypothetical protein